MLETVRDGDRSTLLYDMALRSWDRSSVILRQIKPGLATHLIFRFASALVKKKQANSLAQVLQMAIDDSMFSQGSKKFVPHSELAFYIRN